MQTHAKANIKSRAGSLTFSVFCLLPPLPTLIASVLAQRFGIATGVLPLPLWPLALAELLCGAVGSFSIPHTLT